MTYPHTKPPNVTAMHVYSVRHRFILLLCATSHRDNDLVAATSLNKLGYTEYSLF